MNSQYNEFISDEVQRKLTEALKKSYSPYSKIKVACALVFDNGEIITGCNVENASYSCTICAERCAIFSAVVLGKDLTKVQEVYIQSDQSILFYPCGACLQVMAEFLKTRTIVKVLAKEKEGKKLTAQYTLKELLPHCFKI